MKRMWRNATTLAGQLKIAAVLFALSLGARAQNLDLPLGVAVDANSNIYVASFFGGVTVYGPNFVKKATITQGVDGPEAVAIGPDGTVYTANYSGNSITEYNAGSYTLKSPTISVSEPTQIVVGSYDEIYAVQGNGTLSVFDPLGGLRSQVTAVFTQTLAITPRIAQFWVANQASSPSAFQYDMFTIDIAAGVNGFVAGAPYTTFLPTWAVANPKSDVTWITDYINQHVVRVDANANAVIEITPQGGPYGIALDTTKQRLFVSEPAQNQVEVFSLNTLKRVGLLN